MHALTQKNTHTQTHISQREKENWAVKRLGSIYQTNIWNTGSISVARNCYQELQVGNQVDSPRNYVSLYPCQHILGKKKKKWKFVYQYYNLSTNVTHWFSYPHQNMILAALPTKDILMFLWPHFRKKIYVCWLSIFLGAFLSV